ncbi:MAG: tetratricopeptide repeat protein [Verrucomicrobiota bacterium]|nr:tetratricopeptide repeat protein [Verrucomicrobiota bacterium]
MKSTLTALLAICLFWTLGCGGEPTTDPNAGGDQGTTNKPTNKPLPKDFESLKALAEKGDARAQYKLGYAYDEGQGVPKNDKEAVKWYRKAAEQGYASAQSNLGYAYDWGKGVLEDDVTAYAWYNIAATNGQATAKKNKPITAKKMTADQIAEGQKLSREMLKKNPKLLGE